MKKLISFPFPIFNTIEDKWHVAECPLLGIGTQGKTEQEVKEMIKDLIKEYLRDPDTPKGKIKKASSFSLSYIPIEISAEFLHEKTKALTSK